MADEWQTLTLREAGVTLIDCDHRTPPAAADGYPYVAIPQLRAGRIDLSDVRRISQEHFTEWTRKARPQGNDIILSRRCNPGETAHVPPDLEFAVGQNLVLLRADGKRVYPQFLRWLARGPDWWSQIGKFLNVGAVFDSLRCADVPHFELKIPPRREQHAIAHILGTVDNKIELNRRMNETLEAMARALFKSWFVDFDPVHAKAERRDPGLPQPLADLFPDSFEDSELGEIPRGWTIVRINELAAVERGLSYKGEGLVDHDGLPMINLGCFGGNGVFKTESIKRYTGEYKHRHLVEAGDVVIANTDMTQRRMVLGSPALVPEVNGERRFLFTHHTFALRFKPSTQIWRKYLYFMLLQPRFREIAEGFATGTTVLALPTDGVLSYAMVTPSDSVHEAFASLAGPWLTIVETYREQMQSLTALRDALLPKLVSGDLRVRDAGRIVDAAAGVNLHC